MHILRDAKTVQRHRRTLLAVVGGVAFAAVVAASIGVYIAHSAQSASSCPTSPSSPTVTPAAASMLSTSKLTTVAQFPACSFLENVVVRADGSMLVTELKKKQLWYVPAPTTGAPVQPLLLHTFDQPPFDVVEAERDVFYVDTSNYTTTRDSYLQRVDLRHWEPGMAAPVQNALKFPSLVSSVDGADLLGPNVLLVTDALVGEIWRVDLSADGAHASARVWLKDPSMSPFPNKNHILGQPGVNGVKFDAKTSYLYYTSTGQDLFMRVQVDPATLDPKGAPELVASGRMWDDFALDAQAGVAYVTTHRQNTIERIPLDPRSGQAKQIVAGNPFDTRLAGPSAVVWGRGQNDTGCVAYITTDGGVTAPPPDGIVRPAQVLRADFCDQGAASLETRAPAA
jgi:sugar lactone lactonase YvrE